MTFLVKPVTITIFASSLLNLVYFFIVGQRIHVNAFIAEGVWEASDRGRT